MNRFRKEHGEPAQGGGGFNSSFVGKKHYGVDVPCQLLVK